MIHSMGIPQLSSARSSLREEQLRSLEEFGETKDSPDAEKAKEYHNRKWVKREVNAVLDAKSARGERGGLQTEEASQRIEHTHCIIVAPTCTNPLPPPLSPLPLPQPLPSSPPPPKPP